MEIKTSEQILFCLESDYFRDKKWVSVDSEIKWLNELEARIIINYPKEELLSGIKKHIELLKGDLNRN